MYTDGFGVALILGLLALLSPALWIGWWLLADLGESAYGTHAPHHESAEARLGRAA